MNGTVTFRFVPDHLLNTDGSVDPAKVRWHVVEQVYVNGSRTTDRVYSYATIGEALWHIGHCTQTPVIPCGLFDACEHCARAMAPATPAHEEQEKETMSQYTITWTNADGIERRITGLSNLEADEVYIRIAQSPAISLYIAEEPDFSDLTMPTVTITPEQHASPSAPKETDEISFHMGGAPSVLCVGDQFHDDHGALVSVQRIVLDDTLLERNRVHTHVTPKGGRTSESSFSAGEILDHVYERRWERIGSRVKRIAAAVALMTALTLTSTASAQESCTVVGAWEDGSKIAECTDGTMIALDPDGREAGPWGPAHEAGTWYEIAS